MTGLDLSRALDYPYARPSHSYVFPNTYEITVSEEHEHLTDPCRTAVLAIGSNAAPCQLERKFGGITSEVQIPVLAVNVHDVDVVHANFICSYGATPATVTPTTGSVVEAHMTMLDEAQIKRMDETELGYTVVEYFGDVFLKSGEKVQRRVLMYVARCGLLGGGLGLERMWGGVESRSRVGQFEALRFVMHTVGETGGVEGFLEKVVGDDKERERINELLGGRVEVEDVEGVWEVVRVLGEEAIC